MSPDSSLEVWKDYADSGYEVSSLGRVRRKDTGRISNPVINSQGYYALVLSKHSKHTSVRVHRMVALTFVPNPENKETVNHIDGNKINNLVSNLEWCSRVDNIRHAYATGLNKQAGLHNNVSRFNKKQLEEVRLLKGSATQVAVAKMYGVSPATIRNIWTGKRYPVEKEYKWI